MSDLHRRIADLSPEKQALLAQRLREKKGRPAGAEPLAVVGVALRFPGCDSPDACWKILAAKTDTVGLVPAARWDGEALYAADTALPGRVASRWGAWLEGLDGFDATFFGMAPREAAEADPQQRLLLEVCWEAFEDAGLTMEGLAGSRVGVYVGTHCNDYSWMVFKDETSLDAYAGTGTAHSIVANRVSYLFDLRGPSLAVDTACSASLVAVHLACQGLRAGDCDWAVAGGVNLILSPHWAIAMSRLGLLSPSGRCRTFDARADGIVRGEGCGVVVLRRLADALRDGDRVWAVIRGTATNQDGRTNGITAPNGLAQQDVVRAALADAGVAPETISAVEAHGTGTVLGDPIEVEALAEVLGRGDPAEPCILGSVKTNFGHLEGAAGIAGLIRLVLSLRHETWPGLVHFEALNPHIDIAGTRMVVGAETRPWPRGSKPRRAGVSAFGFGGTNAHVIVEEAPAETRELAPVAEGRPHILPVSARTPKALGARAAAMGAWLRDGAGGAALYDVCSTATFRRSRHEHGVAVAGRTAEALAGRLEAFAGGARPFGVFVGRRDMLRRTRLAFVFSGQGSQWPGMGTALARSEPVFAEALERCDALIRGLTGWSVAEALAEPSERSRLGQTAVAQPAIFAVQVALVAWLEAQGIRPEAVAGHSVGEVAAAYVAGLLTLQQATELVVHRARLMQRATGGGRMVAVELGAEALGGVLERSRGALSLAAVNSPTSCVLSGETAAVERAGAELERDGAVVRFLPVDYAFHSAQMEPLAEELEAALVGLRPATAGLPFVSTVTGRLADAETAMAGYWRRNMREPVRLAEAVGELGRLGCATFLEIGPHPVLARALRQTVAGLERGGVVLGSLQREQDEQLALATALGGLHLLGHQPRWDAFFPAPGQVVSLPPYPWQRQTFPLRRYDDGVRGQSAARSVQSGAAHSLLGVRLDTAIPTWEVALGADGPVWLSDHRILGRRTVPAAALTALGLAAAMELSGGGPPVVENLVIERATVLEDGQSGVLHVVAQPDGPAAHIVQVFARTDDGGEEGRQWTRRATARILRGRSEVPAAPEAAESDHPASEGLSTTDYYQLLAARGAAFGPSFSCVVELWRGDDAAGGVIQGQESAYGVPPGTLDGILQVAAAIVHRPQEGLRLHVPVGIQRAVLRGRLGGRLAVGARLRARTSGDAVIDIAVWRTGGERLLDLVGVHFQAVHDEARSARPGAELPGFYTWTWRPEPRGAEGGRETEDRRADPAWLVVGHPDGLAAELAAALGKDKAEVVPEAAGDGNGRLEEVLRAGPPGGAAWAGVVHLVGGRVGGGGTPAGAATGAAEVALRLLATFQALASSGRPSLPRLLVVTRGASAAGATEGGIEVSQTSAWGIARVIASEHPELFCTLIDLDPSPSADGVGGLLEELRRPPGDAEIAFRHGVRYVARLAPVEPSAASSPGPASRLEVGSTGVLDDLTWSPLERQAPGQGQVELRVLASGVNFRDVLNALGMYPGGPVPLGNECVGEVVRTGPGVERYAPGDLLMGVSFGSIATHALADARLLVPIPSGLSVVEAAAVPIAYLTAQYGLFEVAHLRAGERVLVHAAAGGVGLAAVALAVRAGAEVVATAGSEAKRSYLRSLGVAHVFDSRSAAFAVDIEAALGPRSIDVILNSLSGELIARSLELLSPGGRFVELGKRGIWTDAEVAAVRADITYEVVYLGGVCEAEPERVGVLLGGLAESLARGDLAPLPVAAFEAGHAADAFRFMAQARHIGKIAITQPEAFDVRVARSRGIRPDATYLITGGLGGVGRRIAEWLVARGARALVLTGRREPGAEALAWREGLASGGARIEVVAADVADMEAMRRVFARMASGLPPLRGVVHAAGVLDDGPVVDQDGERLERVLAPKVAGAWNLHELTAGLDLDFFVLCSALAGLIGWAGQAGYAAGNTFLDGLAHYRRARGLPGLSIDWGPWGGAGMAAELAAPHQERLRRWGLRPMSPAAGLAAFERLASASLPQVAVLDADWRAFRAAAAGTPLGIVVGELGAAEADGSAPTEATTTRSLSAELAATPPARRRALIQSHVRTLALQTLGLESGYNLDPRQGLRDVGLDSLMAVELRNALSRLAGAALPSTLLFDFPTLEALTGFLERELAQAVAPQRAAEQPPERRQAADRDIADLSDEEAEALLREELALSVGAVERSQGP